MPEYYQVNSIYGQFWVHESRCLIFRNGVLPERTMQPFYRFRSNFLIWAYAVLKYGGIPITSKSRAPTI
jgi:hypothetical protein